MSNNDLIDLSPEQRALLALRKMRAKLDALEYAKTEPIAIIGMGCRLPGGANDPETFWQLLLSGYDAITEVPADRWDVNAFYDPDPNTPGKMSTRWGGFVQHIDQFDAHFFGISPREAVGMDPQQRVLLEVTWEALEHAGQAPHLLAGSQVGVFIGACGSEYGLQFLDPTQIDAYGGTGNACSIIANRLSYQLDFRGPSVAVDTACSSSLVALHLACQTLRNNECHLALAGGVNLILSPGPAITFSKTRMLSTDGRCKTFDARANGFVRGEGCGVVVLKRLSDAQKAGDNILALVRGSAVNQDGHSTGLTAPNVLSQEAVIRQALAAARLAPEQVSYIEAHGTGTALGDPIEVEALAAVLGHPRPSGEHCWLASVKTNIGHLEAAAGIAGLIKTVLALQHQQIPAHLHFHTLNPHISLQQTPFLIPTTAVAWPSQSKRRRYAGVSSFGMGGTNAHIVLEEAPPVAPSGSPHRQRPSHLLALSAKNEPALRALAQHYAQHLAQQPDLPLHDLCYSAKTTRGAFPTRLAVVTSSVGELQQQLQSFATGNPSAALLHGQASSKRPKIAFLFTGQGAQYAGMGQQLYESEPVFREALERCAQELDPLLPLPLLSVLYGEHQSALDQTLYTQPALFALEYALAHLWQQWGVQPDVVLGHSVGEYVAACLAGVFSLSDGLRLIVQRAQLMQNIEPAGSMLAVRGPAEVVEQVVEQVGGCLSVAAYNGPQDMVIAGTHEQVERARQQLEQQGIKTRRLQVSQAFHSPVLDPMLPAWEQVVKSVAFQPGHLELISNVSGQVIRGQEMCKAEYWMKQVREPVQFARSLRTLQEQGVEVLIEMGPQPTLLGLGKKNWPEGQGIWVPTLRKGKPNWEQILHGLGQLYVQGIEVDWERVDAAYAGGKVVLPIYPFQRQRYWIETKGNNSLSGLSRGVIQKETLESSLHPLLGRKLRSPQLKETVFEMRFSLQTLPFLADHVVHAMVVVPAVVYLELALNGVSKGELQSAWQLADVFIYEAMIIPPEQARTVQLVLTPEKDGAASFQIFSTIVDEDDNNNSIWTLHATGRAQPAPMIEKREILATLRKDCQEPVSSERFYQDIQHVGFAFGPRFKGIQQLWKSKDSILGYITLSEELLESSASYLIYPPLHDACLQVLAIARMLSLQHEETTELSKGAYIPIGVDRLTFYRRPGPALWAHAQLRLQSNTNQESFSGAVSIYDEAGNLVASVDGIHFKRASREALQRSLPRHSEDRLYQIKWQLQQLPAVTIPAETGYWLLLSNDLDLSANIAAAFAEHGERCTRVQMGSYFVPADNVQDHYIVDPANPTDWQALLKGAGSDTHLPCLGVILLWVGPSDGSVEQSVSQGCVTTLNLVQALAHQSRYSKDHSSPRLWLLTRGAYALNLEEAKQLKEHAVIQAPLWGLGRVIALEHSDMWGGLIDLPLKESTEQIACAVVSEVRAAASLKQLGGMPENQVLLRKAQRFVARLEHKVPARVSDAIVIQSDGSYLLTGGLGALGLQVARWLVTLGAKHLVLVNRHSATAANAVIVQELREQGAQVLTLTADITQKTEVARVLATIKQAGIPSLRGIIHAAGVLDDGLLLQQNTERFERVLAPKVAGAWHLHNQTLAEPLDWFVMFSSVASLMGSAGQGAYAAANAFLDGLAQYRHAQGRPALSINWGPWAQVGMAIQIAQEGRLAQRGMEGIMPDQGIALLEQLLKEQAAGVADTQVAAFSINWEQLVQGLPMGAAPAFLQNVIPQQHEIRALDEQAKTSSHQTVSLLAQIEQASSSMRYEIALNYVLEQSYLILGFTKDDDIDVHKPLHEIGMDSLMALDLTKSLGTALEQSLPATLLFDYPTLEMLTKHLLSLLPLPLETTAREVTSVEVSQEGQIMAQVDKLSEEELIALFARELDSML